MQPLSRRGFAPPPYPYPVVLRFLTAFAVLALLLPGSLASAQNLGQEVALPQHLEDGDEFAVDLDDLLAHGRAAFIAEWTNQEGGGRPLTTGTGNALADPSDPLIFPRNFNRVSAPDANSCAGCHNKPVAGGAGDIVANVFVLGQRFDFATFSADDNIILKGDLNELGESSTLNDIANSRATTSMFGGGYIEMLARQITADLQAQRDGLTPGSSTALTSKGISFGTLSRDVAGNWDVSAVDGLPAPSLLTSGSADPPNLIIRPWHQAGAVVSLRQFTNNAMNHHHGMQAEERFGSNVDDDGDGFVNELTRADITATSVWQAILPAPGRVISSDPVVRQAVLDGEATFAAIGCADCHISALPLDNDGWNYTEPNPYNPPGNLQVGEVDSLVVDLNDRDLPGPRLEEDGNTGVTWVPVFTDFKLHDITAGPNDPNREELNMHFPPGSQEFFDGNSRFLTKRLWGAGNTAPYFHHGKFVTMREAILAHAGEAQAQSAAFLALTDYERDSIIEFLKSLQVLPAGSRRLIVDERGRPVQWPPPGQSLGGGGGGS